ncbi:MAG: UDP-N-acetylmuramate--L-alanine ligase [Chloroflexota bacterium]
MSGSWQSRLIERDPTLHIYLVGIGGAGLSGIAQILHEMGIGISGSDRAQSHATERLVKLGIPICVPQGSHNLANLTHQPDIILMSSAIAPDHSELLYAKEAQIPIVKRDRFLPVMLEGRQLIAIAGTHGKSTTTAMVTKVLREAGVEAGYLIGATLPGYGNASAGADECPFFVLEADEYDQMFLGLQPTLAVMTNVEWDHPDCYPTPASFEQAFAQFAEKVSPKGLIISCADDPGAESVRLTTSGSTTWVTYGLDPSADLQARRPSAVAGEGYSVELRWWNAPTGQLQLQVPGLYNLRNALAAIYVGRWCGVSIQQATASLYDFKGTARRFEIKGEFEGITIVDDYAHHPTEVQMTLAAAANRFPERRIWAVFQPHTFSRTEELFQQMSQCFGQADRVLVTDIYAAREVNTGRVSSADLVSAASHPAIRYTPKLLDAVDQLELAVQPGDVVITMGAGDCYQISEMLLERLQMKVVEEGVQSL